MRRRRNKRDENRINFWKFFLDFSSSIDPKHCYKIDAEGSVVPTLSFWVVFTLGFSGLLLVLFNIATGNLAASILVVVILSSIAVFNAGKLTTEDSRKKGYKTLGFDR